MYLLNVLSEDKTSEITTVMALSSSYALLPSSLPSSLSTVLLKTALKHHTHRFYNPTYAGLISSLTAEPGVGKQGPDRGRDVSGKHLSIVPISTSVQGQSVGSGGSGTNKQPGTLSSTSSSGSIQTGSKPAGGGGILANSPILTSSSAPSSTFIHKSDHSIPSKSATKTPSAPADETQTLRTQYGRFLPQPPTSAPSRHSYLALLDEVLGKFYHSEREEGRDGEYRRRKSQLERSEEEWVWLVTPFMCCLTRPVAVYLGFQKLLDRMRECFLTHKLA
jgi:hypothetical protein